jgi:hypothetical protein
MENSGKWQIFYGILVICLFWLDRYKQAFHPVPLASARRCLLLQTE